MSFDELPLVGGDTYRQPPGTIAATMGVSIKGDRLDGNPVLTRAAAAVEAVRRGKIENRTYRRELHAKVQIMRGRLDVIGSPARARSRPQPLGRSCWT